MAVNEVKKDQFVYRDVLFADLGDDKRHPRASVAELRDLLLPKKGRVPPRDQVAHWYEAQLLHYGLRRTKEKSAAKLRLTAAINGGTLAVPSHILQMEADMKKEFAAVTRKAKAAAKAVEAVSSKNSSAPKSKKRKAEAVDDVQAAPSNTKMSFTIVNGNVTVAIDHKEGTASSLKKRKVIPSSASTKSTVSKTTKKSSKLTTEKKSCTASKQSASASNVSKLPGAVNASRSPAKSATTSSTKQTARKSTGTTSSNHPATKQTARRGKPFNPASASRTSAGPPPKEEHEIFSIHDEDDDDDIYMYDAPSPYSYLGFAHVHSSDEDDTEAAFIQVSGTYKINSMFDDVPCELTLVKNTQTAEFWGHFFVADYKGVLRIPNTDGMIRRESVAFLWRAQDVNSGQLFFKRDQAGWIQLDGQGGVRGCWNGLLNGEHIEFEGSLGDEPDTDVQDLIDQWDWFVNTAYGR